MESQPSIRQRFNSDLQNRLALIAYVPILCLGVLAAGGLIFLRGSTGVRIFGIFALLGVALSIFIAYKTISSILDTIGRIAGSAEVLVEAQEALLDNNAEPIEVWNDIPTETDDELGRLAASINSMHTNTVEVDRNQNESIKKGISNIVINLARRSQTLLDRQVEYIDVLERSEEDPERLEQMFKVDHLATRMRRNAESLLVLADADPGRRRGGPVDIADVLRVAMGEIENYQHIELTSVEPGQVTSAAAVDLAHMAAELMENATQFSPPDAPVQVSGRLNGSQYEVSIVDHGMGMPAMQIQSANDVLANPPELGLAMGRSLGFVVIGRLAQRVGATVSLNETGGSGMTANIAVPTTAFSKVGDNSGVRRSIVAPDDNPIAEEMPKTSDNSKSPALTKLLGLDAAALGATETAPQETPANSPAAEDEPAWTPPPVTPDATAPDPVINPSSPTPTPVVESEPSWTPPPVTAEAQAPLVEAESAWTPPTVTPDVSVASEAPAGGELPIAGSAPNTTAPSAGETAETLAAIAADDDLASVSGDSIEKPEWSPPPAIPVVVADADDPPGDGAPPIQTALRNVDAVSDLAAVSDVGEDERNPVAVSDEPGWSPPEVTPGAAPLTQPVFEAEVPSNLEEALPTGEAFESGMASLLEDQDDVSAEAEVSDSPEALAAPKQASTSSGLTRRRRGESRVPIGEGRPVAASTRRPDEIRSMLSRYRDGIKASPSSSDDPSEEG